MIKYRFDWLNAGAELTNPTIEIQEDGITIYPSKMVIDVNVKFISGGSEFLVRLTDVVVQNMNFEPNSLETRTMKRLEDFAV